jgi:hypothetical protein
MTQEWYETVNRQEEYEQDKERINKEMDDFEFLAIIKRRIADKRRRKLLLKTYFGDHYDRENFGDC